ncbi:MAG: PD-(D/E)XK nuclease family protein [Acidobacteriota bacterium]
MDDRNNFYFSQLALSTYLTCQLKFRRRYLEELHWPRPTTPAIDQGNDFHAISERFYLTGEMDYYEGKMGEWSRQLEKFRPLNPQSKFYPEQQIRLNTDIKLVARYDLVVFEDKVYIYDWKTDANKLKKSYYTGSLQTIVYRYLMVEAGGQLWPDRSITPQNVIMCYWNPNYPAEPLYLEYSAAQFKRDGKALHELITEIKNKPWNEFLTAGNKKACMYCEYSPICHGKPEEGDIDFDPDDLSISWDDIEEIGF